jgi:hypothetical protein
LGVDDDLRLLELALQPGVLAAQLLELALLLALALRPALLAQRLQRTGAALLAPTREVRRVQALSPQDRSRLAGRPVDLLEDPRLVRGAEAPTLRLGLHFRIRERTPVAADDALLRLDVHADF